MMMLQPGKRYPVFAIRKTPKEMHVWTRAGNAFVNKDGSLNVVLDVLPLEGRLHVREPLEQRDSPGGAVHKEQPALGAQEAVGGH